MREKHYAYFQNRACEYFPCHAVQGDFFNCLFCFCPLYTLGAACGGKYTYTEKGVKDCSGCILPHSPGGYDYVCSKFKALAALAQQNKE
ncbi:MAG: cysteine-rich small domain-containing protein [Hominenteromicrobium sp.]